MPEPPTTPLETALGRAVRGEQLTGPDEVALVGAGYARFDALGLLWTPAGTEAAKAAR